MMLAPAVLGVTAAKAYGVSIVFHFGRVGMSEATNRSIGGTPRATTRPANVKAPSGWVNSPVPAPEAIERERAEEQPGGRDPVRYGDWEYKGLAIDF